MSEILKVTNLKKYFPVPAGMLHAVDDVSFSMHYGETMGVVGESGCGKSTLGKTILRLEPPTSGEIIFEGEDITNIDDKEFKALRPKMQMIFQDPLSSLNPRMSVSQQIAEPLRIYKVYKSNEEMEKRVLELMDIVGLARRYVDTYPHELDGGRRQRIGIARAGSKAKAHSLRRAGVRPRRSYSGADTEPPAGFAEGARAFIHVHYSRFVRR